VIKDINLVLKNKLPKSAKKYTHHKSFKTTSTPSTKKKSYKKPKKNYTSVIITLLIFVVLAGSLGYFYKKIMDEKARKQKEEELQRDRIREKNKKIKEKRALELRKSHEKMVENFKDLSKGITKRSLSQYKLSYNRLTYSISEQDLKDELKKVYDTALKSIKTKDVLNTLLKRAYTAIDDATDKDDALNKVSEVFHSYSGEYLDEVSKNEEVFLERLRTVIEERFPDKEEVAVEDEASEDLSEEETEETSVEDTADKQLPQEVYKEFFASLFKEEYEHSKELLSANSELLDKHQEFLNQLVDIDTVFDKILTDDYSFKIKITAKKTMECSEPIKDGKINVKLIDTTKSYKKTVKYEPKNLPFKIRYYLLKKSDPKLAYFILIKRILISNSNLDRIDNILKKIDSLSAEELEGIKEAIQEFN
jgi:hypothetical protein